MFGVGGYVGNSSNPALASESNLRALRLGRIRARRAKPTCLGLGVGATKQIEQQRWLSFS